MSNKGADSRLSQAEPVARLGPSGFDPARMTDQERAAFMVLSGRPMMPREFAKAMWPESDGWQRRANCGRGVSQGGGMRLAAGGILGRLRKKYPELLYWDVSDGSRTALTEKGLEVKRAIAMEARQGQDPQGLDRNDDSAAIAQKVQP